MEVAGLGTAGLMVGCRGEEQRAAVAPAKAPADFEMSIWGSCLYVFSEGGKKLEIAFLKEANLPDCEVSAHEPTLKLTEAEVAANSDIQLGSGDVAVPPGHYKLDVSSAHQEVGDGVVTTGLGGAPQGCPAGGAALSLANVPRLSANGSQFDVANWRQRTVAIFEFTKGTLRALPPKEGDMGELSEFELRGGGAAKTPFAVTDFLDLKFRLAGDTITFLRSDGKKLILATRSPNLKLELKANPPKSLHSMALMSEQPVPHFCALYSTFTPAPTLSQRRELHYIRRCSAAKPSVPGQEKGPSPGKYCPGGIVEI